MADNIAFDFEAVDFESAVDEVDIIVPKYLDAIARLEHTEAFEEMPSAVQNVVVYWERLSLLFRQIEPLEHEVPFRQIMVDMLRSELAILERVYLNINLRIEFSEKQCCQHTWIAGETVLKRMDTVLAELGFTEDHEDRKLVSDLLVGIDSKYAQWMHKRPAAT